GPPPFVERGGAAADEHAGQRPAPDASEQAERAAHLPDANLARASHQPGQDERSQAGGEAGDDRAAPDLSAPSESDRERHERRAAERGQGGIPAPAPGPGDDRDEGNGAPQRGLETAAFL